MASIPQQWLDRVAAGERLMIRFTPKRGPRTTIVAQGNEVVVYGPDRYGGNNLGEPILTSADLQAALTVAAREWWKEPT